MGERGSESGRAERRGKMRRREQVDKGVVPYVNAAPTMPASRVRMRVSGRCAERRPLNTRCAGGAVGGAPSSRREPRRLPPPAPCPFSVSGARRFRGAGSDRANPILLRFLELCSPRRPDRVTAGWARVGWAPSAAEAPTALAQAAPRERFQRVCPQKVADGSAGVAVPGPRLALRLSQPFGA